jgi:Flp pilus assembly protein TadB
VSKERARRRAEREHESALRAAARAAEAERRERRQARKAAVRRATTDRLRVTRTHRPTGTLARRRRVQTSLVIALLVALNVLVWVVRPDWPARLATLVVSVLAAPVLVALLVPRRR